MPINSDTLWFHNHTWLIQSVLGTLFIMKSWKLLPREMHIHSEFHIREFTDVPWPLPYHPVYGSLRFDSLVQAC